VSGARSRPAGQKTRLALLAGLIGVSAAGNAFADNWRFSPSIGLQQIYSENTLAGQGTQTDLVTQIVPGLQVIGDTAKTTINLSYAPAYNHYDLHTSPDRVDQSLNGTGSIRPITDVLTVDFVTYASEQGGSANSVSTAPGILVPSSDRVLYYVANVTPHLQQHFRDVATLDAYYRLKSTNLSDEGTKSPSRASLSSNSLQNDTEIILGSGQSFGRLEAKLDFDKTGGSGSGQNNQSTSDRAILQLEYHVTRAYSLTGSAGYQKVVYPATTNILGYRTEGIAWSVGFRAAPRGSTSLSVSFGKQQGAYNPSLEFSYERGRTKIAASYIVTLENQLESALQNVQFLAHDAFGNAIDSRTGLPFSLVNQTFGSQNVLFRDKPALLTVTHAFSRSAITLSVTYDVRSPVNASAASDSALGVSIGYSRDLTPLIKGSTSIGFTDHISSGVLGSNSEHAQIVNAGASLNYQISDRTTANVQETYYHRTSSIPANDASNNQLLIGLRRRF